jgi:hypothetical protein
MNNAPRYKYQVIKRDGTSFDVTLPQVLPLGWSGKIKLGNDEISVSLFGALKILKETPKDTYVKKDNKLDVVLLAVAASLLIALFIALLANINSNIGISPDDEVLRAAQSVSPEAVVSKSQYSWRNGCDNSDTRSYKVFDNYQQVAIICQGNVNPLFDNGKKAPTVRYTTDD